MTAAEIIADAQSLVRNTLGQTPAQLLAWLNRIQRGYARKDDWPELKMPTATVSTTANQAYVNLPAGFLRFAGKMVLYNPTAITGGYQDGTSLPVLTSGDPRLDNLVAAWRPTGAGAPLAVSVSGADGAKKLYLYPMPDTGSVTLVYDYYRAAATLSATSGSPELQELCDTFVMAMAVQFCVECNDKERLPYFMAQEKSEYRAALRNLLTA